MSSDSLCSVRAEAAVGEHAGHDLDEQPDAEALVAAEPLQLRDRRRLRVGGGVAVLVVGPALGDGRVAALAGEQDLVPGGGGGGDVVDDVGVRARPAPRTRTGWSRTDPVVPPKGGTIVPPFWNAIAKHPAADARIV